MPWTAAQVLAALRAFHARTGRWPASSDCGLKRSGLPSATTIIRLWGSMDAARQAAGAPPDALPKRGSAWVRHWPDIQPRSEQE